MIEILIALISMTALSIYGFDKAYDEVVSDIRLMRSVGIFMQTLCPIVGLIGFIGLFFYPFVAWDYFAAEYKRDVINREYGTSYTKLEIFYASDVIDTVRELDRKRIEVNGDLINGE